MLLTINLGSSSQKFALFNGTTSLWRAHLAWHADKNHATVTIGEKTFSSISLASYIEGIEWTLQHLPNVTPTKIAHRVVHGANLYKKPIMVDHKVIEGLKTLSHLAPLHLPRAIEGIRHLQLLFPSASQWALFDTAFHQTIEEKHFSYALPDPWRSSEIRKYGFHGLSVNFCIRTLDSLWSLSDKKGIICHLGSGASVTAVQNKKSVNTSMGFSPQEGLIMGTRSGSLDPYVILYLIMQKKLFPSRIEQLLAHESGLLGITEKTEDMRFIEENRDHDLKAALAYDMFLEKTVEYIGAYIAQMGGIDYIVFSGGIGENSAQIRSSIGKRLSFLGIQICPKKNSLIENPISEISESHCSRKVFVIKTDEELEMALQIEELK